MTHRIRDDTIRKCHGGQLQFVRVPISFDFLIISSFGALPVTFMFGGAPSELNEPGFLEITDHSQSN